jgi:E3 ubiquitin-protein ligase HERC2
MHPVEGPRYKCKVCSDYDLCQNCFETRSHKHSFLCLPEEDSTPVLVGKAGKARKREKRVQRAEMIKEWTRCIKQITVSSREGLKLRLFDGTDSYWQSSGPQGKVSLCKHTCWNYSNCMQRMCSA